jgi:hypothetical protein
MLMSDVRTRSADTEECACIAFDGLRGTFRRGTRGTSEGIAMPPETTLSDRAMAGFNKQNKK